MQRRSFLRRAGSAGVAAAAVAAPAIAQTGAPEVRWRLASSFPKLLDTLYGAGEAMAKRIADATGGKFQIRVFAPGEIVPALQVADAVQAGTVECGYTASYYYIGKNTAFAFETTMPFGLNARQQNAWLYFGGGRQLINEFLREYNIVSFPMGNTGAQMGGWYRKEIKSLADIKGLKMRIPGFGGRIFAALGAVPQNIAGGEIYQALERGTIDAAEWVGPYDDEKLGFYKVAKNYYYPGWWEPSATVSLYINVKAFEALPAEYRAIVEAAAAESNVRLLADYDVKNPIAMQRLINLGAVLRAYPRDVMTAAYQAAGQLFAEEREKNPAFRKIFVSWEPFRTEAFRWFRVGEGTQDNFMYTALSAPSAPAKGAPPAAAKK
jgi:TRAP-type mannitol/chloroaromatic compound transport system substrate-binding protein